MQCLDLSTKCKFEHVSRASYMYHSFIWEKKKINSWGCSRIWAVCNGNWLASWIDTWSGQWYAILQKAAITFLSKEKRKIVWNSEEDCAVMVMVMAHLQMEICLQIQWSILKRCTVLCVYRNPGTELNHCYFLLKGGLLFLSGKAKPSWKCWNERTEQEQRR